ncbi:PREDICTED: uncharacterized protein LOC107334920 [Acropora digitifera]|uniref:uncharacterized protein LOC107334920 n=1 Tax=Acropora digitifera TaxID=70779 RepID=UPI00077A5623|nr:PREDICTED: uncharacterized protein LOC107334920 [Acropora digitifera]
MGFLLSHIGVKAASQCSSGERSISGMFLKGHTFRTVQVEGPFQCLQICKQEERCQSYNFVITNKVCELSNRIKEARPEDFLPDVNRFYMKRPNDRVPLGTIKELAAQSCAEITRSEGNVTDKKEFWIYSDEKANQTMRATCEDVWQKINTKDVCFEGKNDRPGKFHITKTGLVRTMKLVRKSGNITCNSVTNESYWSCPSQAYSNNTLMTIITNSTGGALFPPIGDMEALDGSSDPDCAKNHFYSIDRIHGKSLELVFRHLSSTLLLSRGEELQIWNGQDWSGCYEEDNTGQTCVDVYAWYV